MSMILDISLSLFPLIFIFFLLLVKNKAADVAGFFGWLVSLAIACLYFNTSLGTALKASLSGIIASFPVSLAIGASIFQITLMIETGAMARIVALLRTVSPTNRIVQLLLINCGFGIMATSLGAVTISILPPILISLGYTAMIAIALPAIGYEALCIYALLGIPAVAFASFTGMSVGNVGPVFAQFMPLTSTAVALAMLWLAGGTKMMLKGFVPALVAGLASGVACIGMAKIGLVTITGIVAGVAIILALCLYLYLKKEPLRDVSLLTEADHQSISQISLLKATSPWIALVITSFAVNIPQLPFFKLFFIDLSLPIEIIPGKPESLRLFWQGYFWILLTTLMCVPLLSSKPGQLRTACKKWMTRGLRPIAAASIYFAVAYTLNYSGYDSLWTLADKGNNMIQILASAAAQSFGNLYVGASATLSMVAGVISGSQTSAIAMLTKLHLTTAEQIGAAGLLVAATGAIGGGLASALSPAKLMSAASSIDKLEEAAPVLKRCIGVSIVLALFVGAMAQIFALLGMNG